MPWKKKLVVGSFEDDSQSDSFWYINVMVWMILKGMPMSTLFVSTLISVLYHHQYHQMSTKTYIRATNVSIPPSKQIWIFHLKIIASITQVRQTQGNISPAELGSIFVMIIENYSHAAINIEHSTRKGFRIWIINQCSNVEYCSIDNMPRLED